MVSVESSRESRVRLWTHRGFHAILIGVLLSVIGIRVYSYFATSATADGRAERSLRLKDWHNIGNTAFEKKEWERAVESYTRITEVEPGNLQAWVRLAYALQAAERWDEAIAAHLRVSQFDRATSWALYNIACVYAQKNEKRVALDYLREAVDAGYRSRKPISTDTDLANLLEEPEFPELEELAKPVRLRSVYRRFDFLIGQWRLLTNEGRRAGRLDVQRGVDRYALFGQLKYDSSSVTYSILAYYDPGDHEWKQTWIDSEGSVFNLRSTDGDEETLAMVGEMVAAEGQDESIRLTYEFAEGGMIHHTLSRSRDSGATWEEMMNVVMVPFQSLEERPAVNKS